MFLFVLNGDIDKFVFIWFLISFLLMHFLNKVLIEKTLRTFMSLVTEINVLLS